MNISERISKYNRKLLFTFLAFVLATAILAGFAGFLLHYGNNIGGTPKNYTEVLSEGTEKKRMYVSVAVADVPYGVAYRDSGEKYYLLFDAEDYMYLAELSDDTVRDMEEKYAQSTPETFSYTLSGTLFLTPEDLQDIVIEAIREEVPDTDINESNFAAYFGSTYMDTTYLRHTGWIAFLQILAIVAGLAAVFFLVIWVVSFVRTGNLRKQYTEEQLNEAFPEGGFDAYDDIGVLCAPRNLLCFSCGPTVLPFEDVLWMYVAKRHIVGGAELAFLMIRQKDGRNVHTRYVRLKKEPRLRALLEDLSAKYTDILFGYNEENIKQYREKLK